MVEFLFLFVILFAGTSSNVNLNLKLNLNFDLNIQGKKGDLDRQDEIEYNPRNHPARLNLNDWNQIKLTA